jgi:hypothetical protein
MPFRQRLHLLMIAEREVPRRRPPSGALLVFVASSRINPHRHDLANAAMSALESVLIDHPPRTWRELIKYFEPSSSVRSSVRHPTVGGNLYQSQAN